MPSQPRNMPEQEHSIKARSHELFVEPAQPAEGTKSTKPFPVYLRETPAQPFSPLIKAIFWVLGIIVAVLFLAAVWRMSHRHGRSARPASLRVKAAMMHRPRCNRSRARLLPLLRTGRRGNLARAEP